MSVVQFFKASAVVLLWFGGAQATSAFDTAPAAEKTPVSISALAPSDLPSAQPNIAEPPKPEGAKAPADAKLPKAENPEAPQTEKPKQPETKKSAVTAGGRGGKKKRFGANRKERDEQRAER